MVKQRRLVPLALGLVLLAGCGGHSSKTATKTPTHASTSAATDAPTTATSGGAATGPTGTAAGATTPGTGTPRRATTPTTAAAPPTPTCVAAVRVVEGAGPSATTPEVQKMLISCPTLGTLNNALGAYVPAGQDRTEALQEADETYGRICQKLPAAQRPAVCAALHTQL